jgi:hypothetical protein
MKIAQYILTKIKLENSRNNKIKRQHLSQINLEGTVAYLWMLLGTCILHQSGERTSLEMWLESKQ